ncbi:tegument protein UL35 [Saimiriine betaherpesvirus 4]|uniref:Tegument protein UL35 n=1 Tax=Saimiriine betaherpesvirus 4 TaxID=1535247 RepID=G8XSU9_9BETA|nr:tegument protein UL35 [Saimiriine betaherpesvirus 4]AEV80896.1 tegument protein UL35 [Saimiriine betaherpesvirus 4]
MAMPRPPHPYSFPSLPVNESLNFRADLFCDEHRHFLKELVTVGCGGYVGLLCYGMPSPTYVLETMMDFQIRPEFTRVKLIAAPILAIAIMANHYHNSYNILQETKQRLHNLYVGPMKEKLTRSFRKLCQRLPVAVNAEVIIQCMETEDVTFGTLKQCLSQLNELRDAADLSPSEDTRSHYGLLTLYNLLYVPPKFITSRGVNIYSENLGDVTRRVHAPMRSLIMEQRPRTAAIILDDVSFILSLQHLCVTHKIELQMLRSWIWAKCNELMNELYFVYLQAPELKNAFQDVMSSMQLTRNDPRTLAFQNLLRDLLTFLRKVHLTDIYTVPGYIRFCAFNLISYLKQAVASTSEDEPHSSDSSSSEDITFDVDPSLARGDTIYITKNPFGCSALFKVPSNLSRFIKKRQFIRRTPMYHVYVMDSGRMITRSQPLRNLYNLMLEGGSRQTGTTAKELSQVAERTSNGREVVIQETLDLFADVERRDAPSTSSSTSVSSRESLLERPPRQRRYISVAAFAPYSVARHRRTQRKIRLPRGPAHNSRTGPDTAPESSEADPDPRDELSDQMSLL